MGYNLTAEGITCPRIYVACLAAYNEGHLHGAWLDAAREPWAIWQDINAMLAASPAPFAEEFAIHDHEGFGGVRLREFDGVEHVAALAMFIAEHDALGVALLVHFGADLEEARTALADRYMGEWSDLADYMQESVEACVTVPAPLRAYIDWEAMGRDAELNGELVAFRLEDGVVHVFAGT